MAERKQEIIGKIKAFISRHGGGYRAWYVGISSYAKDRLINGHKVREKDDCWIFRTANSSQVAREIEDYFVNTLGTDGGPGGGDEATNQVYAYKKAPRTNP